MKLTKSELAELIKEELSSPTPEEEAARETFAAGISMDPMVSYDLESSWQSRFPDIPFAQSGYPTPGGETSVRAMDAAEKTMDRLAMNPAVKAYSAHKAQEKAAQQSLPLPSMSMATEKEMEPEKDKMWKAIPLGGAEKIGPEGERIAYQPGIEEWDPVARQQNENMKLTKKMLAELIKEELFGSTEEELEEESYNDPIYQVNDVFVDEATKAAIKGLVGMTRRGRWRLTREDAEPRAAALTDEVISAVQRIAGFAIPRPNQEAFRNMIKLQLQEPLHALLTRQVLSVLPTYSPGGVGGATLEGLPEDFVNNAQLDMEESLMDMLLPISEEAYRISQQARGRGPQSSLF